MSVFKLFWKRPQLILILKNYSMKFKTLSQYRKFMISIAGPLQVASMSSLAMSDQEWERKQFVTSTKSANSQIMESTMLLFRLNLRLVQKSKCTNAIIIIEINTSKTRINNLVLDVYQINLLREFNITNYKIK